MYERFSTRARNICVHHARNEAIRFGSSFVAPEHLLLGLLKDSSGWGVKMIVGMDIDPRKVRLEVERLMDDPVPVAGADGKMPMSPDANRMIEYAMEDAASFSCKYVGSEHLLLAACRINSSVVSRALVALGITRDKAMRQMVHLLGDALADDKVPGDDGGWLKRSNVVFRSLHAVAQRDGAGTDWDAIRDLLGRLLKEQHAEMYPDSAMNETMTVDESVPKKSEVIAGWTSCAGMCCWQDEVQCVT